MLVSIDVGNTETVIGLYRQDGDVALDVDAAVGYGLASSKEAERGLTHHWRLSTVPTRTPDEHAVLLAQLLDLEGMELDATASGIAICSSVPSVTTSLRRMADRWFRDIPCLVVGPGVKTGMAVRYDNPKEVGADRITDAVAAYDLYGGPTIVVDLGTATTIEVVSAEGEYLGGAIAPGVAISMEALYSHAAALRSVELVEPRTVIGRSTAESIQSGVLYGSAAMIDGMCKRVKQEIGEATVIATGGLSTLIAPFSEAISHVEPWLTLHGLRCIYEYNEGER
jgi:type III pantothenate kinase